VNKPFGPVMQNAFVVDDLEAAIHQWSRKLGVGPFFVFEHIKFDPLIFRGHRSDCDMSAAIAYWGDLQIELVQQHNQAASIYKEFKDRGSHGLQHMAVMTEDLDAHLAQLKQLDILPVQHGQVAGGGARFAYVNSDFMPGTMIELVESGAAILGYFKAMREAAAAWDGKQAIVRV
jgi:methylmalonyl-CoA/ethylmalonyl-CoA epimerase